MCRVEIDRPLDLHLPAFEIPFPQALHHPESQVRLGEQVVGPERVQCGSFSSRERFVRWRTAGHPEHAVGVGQTRIRRGVPVVSVNRSLEEIPRTEEVIR